MCKKTLSIGKAIYFCLVEADTHEGSHKFIIRDDDVDIANEAAQRGARANVTENAIKEFVDHLAGYGLSDTQIEKLELFLRERLAAANASR